MIDLLTLQTLALAWDDITQTPGVQEEPWQHNCMWAVTYDGCTYAIGTEQEAQDAAVLSIKDSLWAFRPEFLEDYASSDVSASQIRSIVGDRCEDANDDVTELVGDRRTELIEDAIRADGIGHFLNTYDGESHEIAAPSGEPLIVMRID